MVTIFLDLCSSYQQIVVPELEMNRQVKETVKKILNYLAILTQKNKSNVLLSYRMLVLNT